MTKLSIITTLFYGVDYLGKLLSIVAGNVAAIKESGMDVEIEYIIVNDSPKEFIELPVLNELNYNLRIITPKSNLGIHGARVKGLSYAVGEYILFLDQDDEISSKFLLKQFKKIGTGDLIVSNCIVFKKERGKYLYIEEKIQKKVLQPRFFLWAFNPIKSPGQVLIRRSAIPYIWTKNIMKKNGGDDYFLWLLMIENHCRFVFNFEALYWHRDSRKNLSDNTGAMIDSETEMLEILKRLKCLSKLKLFIHKRRLQYKKWIWDNYKHEKPIFHLLYMDLYLIRKIAIMLKMY